MKGLRRQASRFLVAGLAAVGTDTAVYYLLAGDTSPSLAKAVSFIAGTVVAYVVNKYWTFGQRERSLQEVARFATLYTATLGANVGVNRLALALLPGAFAMAFVAATGTSTVLNFAGQRWWVFGKRKI